MYRFHVAIADLSPPSSGETDGLPRLPIFERLLARAEVSGVEPDWRRWALNTLGCRVEGSVLALARLLAERAGLPVDRLTWFVLTPLHLVAGLTTVHHHMAGPVVLSSASVERLVQALREDFADPDLEFQCVDGVLLLGIAGTVEARTWDPALLAGRPLSEGQMSGRDARRLARLCGEFELWLHARQVSGRDGRLVHALHPWANGDALIQPARTSLLLLAEDPFLQAAQGTPSDAEAALDVWSVAQLLGSGAGFADADRQWAQPLDKRLRDGEITAAEVHVAGRVYELRRGQRWRLWRPVRPWWELLA